MLATLGYRHRTRCFGIIYSVLFPLAVRLGFSVGFSVGFDAVVCFSQGNGIGNWSWSGWIASEGLIESLDGWFCMEFEEFENRK